MRWFLAVSGQKESTAYKLNGLLMMAVFFVARILPIPWLIYRMQYKG